MASIKTISEANTHPDGVCVGSADTEKLGFHGVAPVVRASVAKAAGSNPTKAEFDALIDALVAKGLIKLP